MSKVLQKFFRIPSKNPLKSSTVVASVTDTQTHTHKRTFGLLGLLSQAKKGKNLITTLVENNHLSFCYTTGFKQISKKSLKIN